MGYGGKRFTVLVVGESLLGQGTQQPWVCLVSASSRGPGSISKLVCPQEFKRNICSMYEEQLSLVGLRATFQNDYLNIFSRRD